MSTPPPLTAKTSSDWGVGCASPTIYVIDNFDYEGRMDEDAIAGLAWDFQVASKRYEMCPCESLAAIVRALRTAFQEVAR